MLNKHPLIPSSAIQIFKGDLPFIYNIFYKIGRLKSKFHEI